MRIFILLSLILISCSNKPNIAYLDAVSITSGFYAGLKGCVIAELEYTHNDFMINLTDASGVTTDKLVWAKGKQLKKTGHCGPKKDE